MADEYIFESSQVSDAETTPFVSKDMLYIVDQNGGNYNGQILFDTSSLSNSGKWLDWKGAYLEIPFVISMRSTVDISGANIVNSFVAGLKNGSHQIIDSIQMDLNNQNVIQLTPFTNFYVSYKLNTTMSNNDIVKYGSLLNYFPDTPESFVYSNGAALSGNGVANNRVAPTTALSYTSTAPIDTANIGFLNRLRTASRETNGGLSTIQTNAQFKQTARNSLTPDAGANAAKVYNWNLLLTIRFKDLSDFFEQMPLSRGSFFRITINYNSCSQAVAVTYNANADLCTLAHTVAPTMLSGRTNPIMIASAGTGQPLATIADTNTANKVLTLECGVVKTSLSGNTSVSSLPNARICVPAYILKPSYEMQYVQASQVKEIVYDDIYSYVISNVGVGQSISAILTNGIVNPRKLVVIPFINGSAGGANYYADIALSPWQSGFDPSPATTSPGASLSRFNVQLSGKNVFNNDEQYDYEAFVNELSQTGVNGGKETGLASGIIGFREFQSSYRYYVADLSRRKTESDSTPLAVQLTGTPNTQKVMDLVCFLTFRRSVMIDVASGEIVGAGSS
jgi:hypothetical protein